MALYSDGSEVHLDDLVRGPGGKAGVVVQIVPDDGHGASLTVAGVVISPLGHSGPTDTRYGSHVPREGHLLKSGQTVTLAVIHGDAAKFSKVG